MRKAILAALLFSSPAWSAGDAGEALCDNPGAGVTCVCSEPFTYPDGVHTSAFNPGGSTVAQCKNGGSAVFFDGATTTSVLSNGVSNPITVGGSGYTMKVSSTGRIQINDSARTFTDGTYCTRRYIQWDPAFECGSGSSCNFKGPRFESQIVDNHTGFEISGGDPNFRLYPGVYWGSDHGAGRKDNDPTSFGCAGNSPDNGCGGTGKMRSQNPDNLTFERMQGGWTRWEICMDHNLTEAQVDAANAAYGTAIVYPGEADRMYFRARQVQVTGTYAGDTILFGPTYTPTSVNSSQTGEITRLFSTAVGSRETEVNGEAWLSYVMATHKTVADPLYWIGPALEVTQDSGGAPAPPIATPTPTPTPTPDESPASAEAAGCPNSSNPDPAVLYCDDFDDGIPISEKWNTYNSGGTSYVPLPGIGVAGSAAMRASWTQGQVSAGSFSIGLGQLPTFYLGDPGGENWQHVVSPTSKFREIYFRQYLRIGIGWSGIARKYSRIRVLSDPQPGDTPHPTAFQGHFWQQINTNNGGTIGAMYWNNSNGVDENGTVIDTGNNSNTSVWIAQTRGSTAVFQDYPAGSDWLCIEAHIKLNDPGVANGIEEFWIDGQLEARRTNQNHVGIYTAYGLNQVAFDNYWNGGSPQYNELYRDNIVISTERIGCLPDSVVHGEGGDGPVGKPGTPYVIDQ